MKHMPVTGLVDTAPATYVLEAKLVFLGGPLLTSLHSLKLLNESRLSLTFNKITQQFIQNKSQTNPMSEECMLR